MSNTQDHLLIEDIKDNLVFLKNGSVSTLIESNAVNFGLLFETEQIAIIDAFAMMLNSLSFPIQIIIRSERLDVTSYLGILDQAINRQTNPLLRNLTIHYRQFIDGLIKENEVLDKRFYICIVAHSFELGALKLNIMDRSAKAMTILKPRIDHIIRQLARAGLRAKTLQTEALIKLYYDIYNGEEKISAINYQANKSMAPQTTQPPTQKVPMVPAPISSTNPHLQRLTHTNVAAQAMGVPVLQVASNQQPEVRPVSPTPNNPHFVVEELPE